MAIEEQSYDGADSSRDQKEKYDGQQQSRGSACNSMSAGKPSKQERQSEREKRQADIAGNVKTRSSGSGGNRDDHGDTNDGERKNHERFREHKSRKRQRQDYAWKHNGWE